MMKGAPQMARRNYNDILGEQQKQFDELAKAVGNVMAIFYCCVRFDVPFDAAYLPKETRSDLYWEEYIGAIECAPEYDEDANGGKGFTFLDGVTSAKSALQAKDVAKGDGNALTLPGTPKQRKDWGVEKTQKEYNDLDRIYNSFASDLIAQQGNLSVKQEFILRDCAVMKLEHEKMVDCGEYDKAAKLNKMILDNLASEGLRKRDAKPLDDFRLDTLTQALEKAGLMKNGKLAPPPEIFKKMFCSVPGYPYTLDAAEQMLLHITNCMRQNDGLPELSVLPDDMRIEDNLGEFAREQNEAEKEAYKKMGIVKMPPNRNWEYRDEKGDISDIDVEDGLDDDE